MTHITQIILDFATAARLRLCDCYDWHQAVWKAFPGRDGEARDFLTRLDRVRNLLVGLAARASKAVSSSTKRHSGLSHGAESTLRSKARVACIALWSFGVCSK